MHWHECNTHNFLFNLENQSRDFSYTIFPVKKINVGKILKLWENCYLTILSIHILKLEISGCDRSLWSLEFANVRSSGSRFGEDMGSRTCESSVSWTVSDSNFRGRPVRESVEGWVRGSQARTRANQRRNDGKFGNPLKTQFGGFTRRYWRTRREAKSKLLPQKVRV
jgi:hypothetical protein